MVGDGRTAGNGARPLSGRIALLLLVVATGGAAARAASFEQFTVLTQADGVRVSFRLGGLPAEEDLERLRSGLAVAYRHRVEVLARRTLPLWPAKVVARATIDVTASYDSLTDRYELGRTLERKTGSEPSVERRSTESADEMREWLVGIADLELPVPADALAPARFRVRVQSTVGRREVLWLFPAKQTLATEWRPAEEAP